MNRALLLTLTLTLTGCTGISNTKSHTPQGDAEGLMAYSGEALGTSYFRAGGQFFMDHGSEGYCRFVDRGELTCQTGITDPEALPSGSLPQTLDRGPCYVKRACWAGSVTVKRGDLVLRGETAAVQGEERYLFQKHLGFMQSSAEIMDLYIPFWEADGETWDDTSIPLGQRCFWSEIEISAQDGLLPAPVGGPTVVLEPTAQYHQVLDLQQVLDRYSSLTASATEPFVGLFFKYLKWSKQNNGWIKNRASIFADWSQIYHLNLEQLPDPQIFVKGGGITDITNPQFWSRDLHSASRAAWAMIWGWHAKAGSAAVRDLFLNAPQVVAAVDVIFPGRLAAWLEQSGYVTVRDRPTSVALRVKQGPTDPWQSSHLGRAPVSGIDLEVTAVGPAQQIQLKIFCQAGQPAAWAGVVSMPLSQEFPDLCAYDAGHHAAVVELISSGKVLATDQATIAVAPTSVRVQKGDILVFGSPATEPSDKKVSGDGIWRADSYNTETYLAFVPTIGKAAGVYAPFFGPDLLSWDDSLLPLGGRYYWGHIQLATADEEFPIPDGFLMVVLRPTATMRAIVDTLAAADKLPTVKTPYSQPFVGVFLRWLKLTDQTDNYYDRDAQDADFWTSSFGLDLNALPTPTQLQYAPQLALTPYTDLTQSNFWQRDVDCSSLTMWSLIWGWQQQEPAAAAFFLNNLEAVAAIDALAPGQVAWWLQNVGFATIVN